MSGEAEEDPELWQPETPEELVMRAQTWDRQCRRARQADSELAAGLYPAMRQVAFHSRQQAREVRQE